MFCLLKCKKEFKWALNQHSWPSGIVFFFSYLLTHCCVPLCVRLHKVSRKFPRRALILECCAIVVGPVFSTFGFQKCTACL
jgi:hypothetical protein